MSRPELRERLRLMALTDDTAPSDRSLLDVVRAALAGGATAIQLRNKTGTAREIVQQALALGEETRRVGALLFVNDRLDVALAAGADGAHVGDDDLPLEAARRIAPPGFLIGRSVDSADQAAAAARAGADYVGLGPIFPTPSKLDTPPAIGLEGIVAARRVVDLPIVAIGGIDASNAEAVAAAGADGAAVIRAVMGAEDPSTAARAMIDALTSGLRAR